MGPISAQIQKEKRQVQETQEGGGLEKGLHTFPATAAAFKNRPAARDWRIFPQSAATQRQNS